MKLLRSQTARWSVAGAIVAAALVVGFLLFVWPTPYRDAEGIRATRVNRLTGEVQQNHQALLFRRRAWWDNYGWQTVGRNGRRW